MSHKQGTSRQRQKGNILMLAIFSIVALAALGVAMLKISWSQTDTTTREVLGTRAWFAAVSGTEFALARLFPLQTDPANKRNPNCDANTVETVFQSQGLHGCRVGVTCQEVGTAPYLQYYIESIGECGAGEFRVIRIQETWARGDEDKVEEEVVEEVK